MVNVKVLRTTPKIPRELTNTLPMKRSDVLPVTKGAKTPAKQVNTFSQDSTKLVK